MAADSPVARTVLPPVAAHLAQDQQHERRPEHRHEQRAEKAVCLILVEQSCRDPAAEQTADNTDEHGAEAAVSLATRDEPAGDGACQQTDDDPSDEAHALGHRVVLLFASVVRSSCVRSVPDHPGAPGPETGVVRSAMTAPLVSSAPKRWSAGCAPPSSG